MASILLFRDDQEAINADRFLDILNSMAGVSDITIDTLRNNPYLAPIECNYVAEGDSIIINLSTDSKAIYISDLGPAAYDFTIRLQASFVEPLRMIDEGYNFDVHLKDYQTPEELEAAVDAAYEVNEDDG